MVIDLGVFANYLFLRPQYQHYYFGDYYATNYRAAGFYPSYSYNTGRFGYDPIYAYDRWQHRQDRGWEQRQQADFQNLRDHADLRPPRTWAAQRRNGRACGGAGGRSPVVAMPFSQFTKSQNSPLRFQPLDQSERKQFSQNGQEVQRFRQQRQTLETNVAGAPVETRTKEFVPAKVKHSGSPIVAKPVTDFGKDRALPKVYEAPKPDLKIEPKPRATRSVEQPKVERTAPQSRDKDSAGASSAGSKQDKHKDKDKN